MVSCAATKKGIIIMSFKALIVAAFCAAAVAGCGPSKEEVAQVSEMRKLLDECATATEEMIALKGENAEGTLKLKVDVQRARNLLAQPADVKQLPAIQAAMKELEGAQKALQDEVDRQIDEVRKANEAARNAQ